MKFYLGVLLALFLLLDKGIYAQPDALASLQEALLAKYRLTTAAGRQDLVTAGTAVILKKGNLVSANAAGMIHLSNTYKDGRITQGFMGRMANGADGTRTFIAGEKLWVTAIEVRPKGIVFVLISDLYEGVRYRSSLLFPFAGGGAPPPAADALAAVSEVFDAEQSGAKVDSSPLAHASQVREITNWDSQHGRLTSEDLRRINLPSLQFDLNFLRLHPSALDQKPVMQYFIALNNCNDQNVARGDLQRIRLSAAGRFLSLPRIANPGVVTQNSHRCSALPVYRRTAGGKLETMDKLAQFRRI